MEKKDSQYEKLLKLLRQPEAGITEVDVENLADWVMAEIRQEKEQSRKYSEALYRLFYWAFIPWMRNALTTVMILVIAFFMFQNVSLDRKVSRLESQLIQTEYNYYQSPYTSKKNLMKYIPSGSFLHGDSVSVSRKDLDKLLNEYLELKNQSPEIPKTKNNGGLRKLFRNDTSKFKTNKKYPSI
jgi:hypothetical protein